MNQEEIINTIVHVCAVIIVNADHSDLLLLDQLLADNNRAIFVSTAIQIALRMGTRKQGGTQALKLQLKMTPQELADAINPKKNYLKEEEFESLVRREVARLKSSTE